MSQSVINIESLETAQALYNLLLIDPQTSSAIKFNSILKDTSIEFAVSDSLYKGDSKTTINISTDSSGIFPFDLVIETIPTNNSSLYTISIEINLKTPITNQSKLSNLPTFDPASITGITGSASTELSSDNKYIYYRCRLTYSPIILTDSDTVGLLIAFIIDIYLIYFKSL